SAFQEFMVRAERDWCEESRSGHHGSTVETGSGLTGSTEMIVQGSSVTFSIYVPRLRSTTEAIANPFSTMRSSDGWPRSSKRRYLFEQRTTLAVVGNESASSDCSRPVIGSTILHIGMVIGL
ncbi:MAG: hypothetical protein KDD44_10530, partial [Bdellovibrionales bacterium]|nr:hypothetical protein [Bdellovibrionales bacterium]